MAIILETYEDRPEAWTGLQLLAASLGIWGKGTRLRVWGLSRGAAVFEWLSEQEQVIVNASLPERLRGWSVKPWALLQALDTGQERATWIDSDVIATPRFQYLLNRLSGEELIGTEEVRYAEEPHGSLPRTPDLGLEVSRILPRTINSSVISVHSGHRPLLHAWANTMAGKTYQEAQELPFSDRPFGLRGDQDVLTGLLGARPFERIPVQLLREGVDIAHCKHTLGFSTLPRIRALVHGLPPLVHAQGENPWIPGVSLSTQLSPYGAIAPRILQETLDGPVAGWSRPSGILGRALHLLALGHPVARGIPLTVIRELEWHIRKHFLP